VISFLFSVKVSHVIEAPVLYLLPDVAAGLLIYVCFNELLWWAGRIIEYDTPSKLLENESSEFSRLIKEYSRRSHGFSGTANNWMATREWIQDGESRYRSWLPHNISIYDKYAPKPHGQGLQWRMLPYYLLQLLDYDDSENWSDEMYYSLLQMQDITEMGKR